MEPSNVNNLNGVPNFGHGMPEDITIKEETQNEVIVESAESDEGVQVGEVALGVEEGAESEEPKASHRGRPKRSGVK